MQEEDTVLDTDAMTDSACDLLDLLTKLDIIDENEPEGYSGWDEVEHFTARIIDYV